MKRIAKCLVILLALCMVLSASAMAEGGPESVLGQPIAATSGRVYLLLTGGEGRVLYALPVGGSVLSQVDTSAQIDDAIAVEDTLYYLRQNGASFEAVSLTDAGESRVAATFPSGKIAYKLTSYEGSLYCLVDGKLNQIDLATSQATQVSDRNMDEYVICDGVVYYVSSDDTKEYNHESLLDSTGNSQITQSSGMLYAMRLDGSNDTLILSQGVDTLKLHDGYLYFHNLNDNYVMANSEEEWLEGLLYRLNLASNSLTPVLTSYDWNYAPTDAGLMVYKSTGIELGSLSGDDFATVYTPETYTTLGVNGTDLYVFEHTNNTLTRVSLQNRTSDQLYSGGVTYDPNANVANTGDNGENTDTQQGTEGQTETVEAQTPADTTVSTGATETETAPKTSYRRGDKGDEVRAFQTRLVALGYLGSADGDFGAKTEAAVTSFQRKAGLAADGVVGPATMAALYKNNAPTASTATDSSYLLKDSATKYLTEADVKKLDKSMWSFARNEILARHGYEFQTKAYANYFGNKTWYKAGGFSWSNVSAVESANIQLIKDMEDSVGGSDKGQYIFPNSSTTKLTEAQVRALSRDQLGYARNEILARHGYSFTTAKYKNYFAGKSWYKEGGFSWGKLNATEQANIELIKYVEENP